MKLSRPLTPKKQSVFKWVFKWELRRKWMAYNIYVQLYRVLIDPCKKLLRQPVFFEILNSKKVPRKSVFRIHNIEWLYFYTNPSYCVLKFCATFAVRGCFIFEFHSQLLWVHIHSRIRPISNFYFILFCILLNCKLLSSTLALPGFSWFQTLRKNSVSVSHRFGFRTLRKNSISSFWPRVSFQSSATCYT